MKKSKFFFAAVVMAVASIFTACEPKNDPALGPGAGNNEEKGGDSEVIDWSLLGTLPEGCLTVAEAREIAGKLASGESTAEFYYVRGYIKKLHSKNTDGITQYGNASFYMVDEKDASDDFLAYQVYALNSEKFTSVDQVAVGDLVVIKAKLTNYNGTLETTGKGEGFIIVSTNPNLKGGNPTPGPGGMIGDGSLENPFTASDVIALNSTKNGPFFVKAFIVGQIAANGKSMSDAEFLPPFSANDKGSNTNILVSAAANDTTNVIPVQLPTGALRDALNLPTNLSNLGAEVVLYGSLEAYFSKPGIKNPTYAIIGGKEFGVKPTPVDDAILNETLMSQASYDKFTAVNVSGAQVWSFDAKYGAKMSGYNNDTKATEANEDWFVSPAMDLTGKTGVTVSFEHAFGPAANVPTTNEAKAQYTVWVSNNFNGDVAAATWTKLEGMVYGTAAWGYVSSGELAIPAANLGANCRIAWKYVCNTESATWEIKNVVVK